MDVCGVGTGIIECLRIAKMIERHGERFLCRVFTEHEIQYCQRRHAATQLSRLARQYNNYRLPMTTKKHYMQSGGNDRAMRYPPPNS